MENTKMHQRGQEADGNKKGGCGSCQCKPISRRPGLWYELVDCPHRTPPEIPVVCQECKKPID